jgi:hypothetical protein
VTNSPAGGQRFEIVIRGRLSQRFATALDGVTLVTYNGRTTLRADLVDQSALYGLLNRLRDFGIELISVNRSGEDSDAG